MCFIATAVACKCLFVACLYSHYLYLKCLGRSVKDDREGEAFIAACKPVPEFKSHQQDVFNGGKMKEAEFGAERVKGSIGHLWTHCGCRKHL